MDNYKGFFQEIKRKGKFLLLPLLLWVVFVGGVLFANSTNKPEVVFSYPKGADVYLNKDFLRKAQELFIISQRRRELVLENIRTKGKFVASRNGKYFYPATCSRIKNIRQANRVWFNSRQEAEEAGFILYSRCPL